MRVRALEENYYTINNYTLIRKSAYNFHLTFCDQDKKIAYGHLLVLTM